MTNRFKEHLTRIKSELCPLLEHKISDNTGFIRQLGAYVISPILKDLHKTSGQKFPKSCPIPAVSETVMEY